jgi:MIP family channel proteins
MRPNRLLAEALGTFTLVLVGCGAIVVNDTQGGVIGHLGISFAFGLVVMAMIYALGNVSGAHLNPAVTLGFVAARRMPLRETPVYFAGQVLGALAAAALLRLLFPVHPTLGATTTALAPGAAFGVEVVLSFLLMFVILNVSTGHQEKGIMAGVAVGGMVFLDALVGGPLTGASMNPARSLGPALLSGHLENLWIYLTAPVAGTVLAFPTCRWTQGQDCCTPAQGLE